MSLHPAGENGQQRSGAPCQVCGLRDYPHECLPLVTILNSLYYCPDGREHAAVARRPWHRKPRCGRCGETLLTGRVKPEGADR